MKFPKLYLGQTLKRYKRFLADIQLDSGEIVTAHLANPGSMKSAWEEGWKVALSYHDDPKRKLKYSVELVHNSKCWICVNTSLTNKIVEEALLKGAIEPLSHYKTIKREVKYNDSRLDFLCTQEGEKDCFIEAKAVSMVLEGKYQFPDAVTSRGAKHLNALNQAKEEGYRSILLFVVQRSDSTEFKAADSIDPKYAELLAQVVSQGVEVLVVQSHISPEEIVIDKPIPFLG